MTRKRRHDDHTNHEAWAIPYGDLVTLLLAFFVVMYAVSTVNEGKYRVLSDSLNAAFQGAPRSMEPVQVGTGASVETSLAHSANTTGQSRQLLEAVPLSPKDELVSGFAKRSNRRTGDGQSFMSDKEHEAQLAQIADSVEASVARLVADDLVVVRRTANSVEVEIKADILFPSGSATLSPTAVDVIARLADVLRDFPNSVRVEGHTDNMPIKSLGFPSNWELSAARAASVVQLLASRGVNPSRLEVLGLAEFRPIASNETLVGRNTNRRVMMVITNGSTVNIQPAEAAPQKVAQTQ